MATETRLSPCKSFNVETTVIPFTHDPPMMVVRVWGENQDGTIKEVHRELHANRRNAGKEVDLLVINTVEEYTGRNVPRPEWEEEAQYNWLKEWPGTEY